MQIALETTQIHELSDFETRKLKKYVKREDTDKQKSVICSKIVTVLNAGNYVVN